MAGRQLASRCSPALPGPAAALRGEPRWTPLQEGLADGIEGMAEGVADVDPAPKAEARNAAAVETMRTAHRASMAGARAPA